MTPKQFMVMQSGFVTQQVELMTLPPVDDNLHRDYVMNKDYLRDKHIYFYSKEVTDLFNRFYVNPTLMNDMDFRELIIKAAFSHLNVSKFETWIHEQSSREFFSELHNEFIEQTLQYLAGTPRKIHVFQWINLLSAGDKIAKPTQFKFIDYFGRYEPGRTQFHPKVNVIESLPNMVIAWLQKPNGFEDLLTTLYVIFGNRKGIRDVADRHGH